MKWLLLTVPLALLASWYHPRWWVRLDVQAFVRDGAKNARTHTFHRQRFTWRLAVALLVALAGAAPLLRVHGLAYVLLATALLVWQAAYWTYDFNPRLNVARQLPYVGRYHVSWSPDAAAFPDRYIWQQVEAQLPDEGTRQPEHLRALRVELAAVLLEDVLRKVLVSGSGAAGLLAVAAGCLAATAGAG